MIEEIQFSGKGDTLTEFEVRLLSQSKSDAPWVRVAQRLIADLGVRDGACALCVVLDELSGEKLYITPRQHFFKSLWTDERDALIVDLAGRPDWNFADIGRALGVSREYVRRVVGRQPQGPTIAPTHGRHRT